MAVEGELTGWAESITCECGEELPLKVLRTCAFYVGRFCPKCGPYSRETDYFKTETEAIMALASHKGARTTEYRG